MQGEWSRGSRLVSKRLSVTADRYHVLPVDIILFEDRQDCVAKALANPVIEIADFVHGAFGWFSRCAQQGVPKLSGV